MTSAGAIRTVRIGDVLVERGLVTEAQINEALTVQKSQASRQLLGELLIDLGHVTPAQLTEALADAYEIPFVRLTPKYADPAVLNVLPREFVEERDVLPLFRVDGVLTVAITELSNLFLVEEISQLTNCTVQIVAVLKEDLVAVLEQLTRDSVGEIDTILEGVIGEGALLPSGDGRADLEELGSDSPVIQLVNHAIQSAIRGGASDIHFEPDEDSFRVRFRIDGRLVEKIHPPPQMQAAIVSRVKIMAGMDISERRLPQDGAIRVTSRGNPVDLRVSTLPNKFGEKVVIRVIDNSNSLITFEGLELSPETRDTMVKLCSHPYGIILVTGPTGSGKSTTLYSMLNQINDPTVNICTVEDPIEFNVQGVNQFQVHSKINLTFASVLRTLLRQDPDVIMVGEIRDPETAAIAVQAALTGHLVLSTLHTNDSAGAITRLQNLGIEPFLISAALIGIVAQRLVRCVCPECKTLVEPSPGARAAFERVGAKIDRVAIGRGCSGCSQIGYKGRSGIYEILVPDDAVCEAIASGANLGDLRRTARQSGMKTLFEYGMERVLQEKTSVEELLRVTCE